MLKLAIHLVDGWLAILSRMPGIRESLGLLATQVITAPLGSR